MTRISKRHISHMLEHCNDCPYYEPLPGHAHTPGNHKQLKQKKCKSTQALLWFKTHIPQPHEWRTAQMDRGLDTVQSYITAIRSVASGSPSFGKENSRSGVVADQADALSVARCLAKEAHTSRKEAMLHQSVSAFRSFIVLSICIYLEFTRHSWKDLNTVISGLGVQREEKKRKKLFRAVKAFNHRIIPAMLKAGWPASRVTELLFLTAPSLTYFIEIQGQLDGLESYLQTLPYNKDTFASSLDPKFTVPGFIITVLAEKGVKISPSDVYAALNHGEPGLENFVYHVSPVKLPAPLHFHHTNFMATGSVRKTAERRTCTTSPRAGNALLTVDQRQQHSPLYRHVHTYSLRPRTYEWCLFSAILDCDLQRVAQLLESGAASVWDTDPYGLNATYYAGYYLSKLSGLEASLPMCWLLRQHGAPMGLTDDVGNTIVDNLVECALVTRARDCQEVSVEEVLSPVATFTGQAVDDLLNDYLEGHCLTSYHQGLLQLEGGISCTSILDVDTKDAKGRSTLAWATEFGMVPATKYLLALGADPNQHRKSHGLIVPILHSIIAGSDPENPDCRYLDIVSILLEKGTDPDSKDHEEWTPWHVAASWNHYNMARVLLTVPGQQGIDLLAKTRNGETALQLATDPDFVSKVKRLVIP